jgi:hypothetical protein
MPTTFSMFDTTVAGAIAAIKAAILASSDWSNPAGDRLQCTTTRGAAMVVDLSDAAITARIMQLGVYRTTALADKIVRYLEWKSALGATTDVLHCIVSAGKEHLFMTVEGPRLGEVNSESASSSSYRPVFFLCDLVPYFGSDTQPAVVCGGTAVAVVPTASTSYLVYVSRNAANNASWVPAVLETLQPPRGQPSSIYRYTGQSLSAGSGGITARPYVVFEDTAGLRGRLAPFFCLGWNLVGTAADFPAQSFSRITIGSATYLGVPVNRAPTSSGSSPFGATGSTGDGEFASPVVAVPYS